MFHTPYSNFFDRVPAEVVHAVRRKAVAAAFGRPGFGFEFPRPGFGPGPQAHVGADADCAARGPDFGLGGPGGFGPFGPGWGGGPHGRGRGRKRHHDRRHGHDRRGFDLRAAVLTLLAEEPLHGYELMRRISERSQGVWRPSPGSIYPALAKLRDEGLVLIEQEDGRKVAKLTETGRAHVEEFADELGEVWAEADSDEAHPLAAFWEEAKQLMVAARQITHVGDPDQLAKAAEVVAAARRKVYALLAEDGSDKAEYGSREE